jgi:ATP-dependent helicase HrpB
MQDHLRPDLRVMIMSATLDGLSLQSLLAGAPVIRSEGRAYPVTTHYLDHQRPENIDAELVGTVRRVLREEPGDILVFLPGQGEIRRIEALLTGSSGYEFRPRRPAGELPPDVDVCALYGDASAERQKAALAPSPAGKRKIILSTSIAESSLTIDGVRVVVDAGLSRGTRFDPRRGMSGLVTVPVSQASADQRRGRAGREAPGACYRLWSERDHASLPAFGQPEIVNADLAPLALELSRWGTPHGEGLRFIDPPPAAHLSQAYELLFRLGAVDERHSLTPHGRLMAELPVHPRYAHMLVRGKALGRGALACDVAALLDERDLFRGSGHKEIDLHARWHALRSGSGEISPALRRVREEAARLRRLIGAEERSGGEGMLGVLLALAYPERVARRREAGKERYQMSGGTGGTLPKGNPLAREEYLAVGEVDGAGSEVKIFLAEPLTEADIRATFKEQLVEDEEVRWDPRQECVVAREKTRFGAIELAGGDFRPGASVLLKHMIEGIRAMGLDALPWTGNTRALQSRSEWLRSTGHVSNDYPCLSDECLLPTLEDWLGPYLEGMTRRAHLAKLDLTAILDARFTFQQRRLLERLAPPHLIVPTGSRIPLIYAPGSPPVLAVRLQEMFGETGTPAVCDGRVKVLLHLLSPAKRPLAVTQDLPSFWQNAYPQVRKDMRGRYPKHYWPENPLEAEPTRRVKRK